MRVLDVGKQYPVTGLAYSPDSGTLATVAPTLSGRNNWGGPDIVLWDVADGEIRHRRQIPKFEMNDPGVTFSPDGRGLAVVESPHLVFDLTRSEPLTSPWVWPCDGYRAGIRFCFAADGPTVHGIIEGKLVSADPRTAAKPAPLTFVVPRVPGHASERVGLCRAANAELYALAVMYTTANRREPVRYAILYRNSGSERTFPCIEWTVPTRWLFGLILNSDGGRVAVINGRSIRVWDVASGAELAVLMDGRKEPKAFAFSADGRYLGVLFQDSVSLYDTTSWTVARTYAWNIGKLLSLAFSPDGATAAVGSDTGKVVVFDLE